MDVCFIHCIVFISVLIRGTSLECFAILYMIHEIIVIFGQYESITTFYKFSYVIYYSYSLFTLKISVIRCTIYDFSVLSDICVGDQF
jgi:hypothetical protein